MDLRFTGLAILATYAAVAAAERMPKWRLRDSSFLRPFFATDVGWYLAAMALTLSFSPAFESVTQWRAGWGLSGLETLALPLWLQAAIAAVLYDLGATSAHRILHRFDGLWRLHKVHHSSRTLDWLATTRAHAFEHLFRGIPVQAGLILLGVPAPALAMGIALYALFATLGHSNLRVDLRGLEWLFVTPRIHHLHHAPETTHRNFGTIFTLWDRLAGTLVVGGPDPDEDLGVPGETDDYPQTWGKQWLEPFRA